MTEKLTAKQQAFANKYVECGNASGVYRHAYDAEKMSDEAIWVEASKLLTNPKVALRLIELQEAARERAILSVTTQTRRLQELSRIAESYDTPSGIAAAISAEKEINKLNALIVDRSVIDTGVTVKRGMSALYADLDAFESPRAVSVQAN